LRNWSNFAQTFEISFGKIEEKSKQNLLELAKFWNLSFQNLKTSYFNSFILRNNSPQGAFDRSKEKISMLEFELEHNKDIIINLRREIIIKNKEIFLLKVNNNKRNEECQRTLRVIQEILKQCDSSIVAGFTAIENNIQFNSEKNNDIKNKNNNNLPQIGNMLHFSTNHQKRFKEII